MIYTMLPAQYPILPLHKYDTNATTTSEIFYKGNTQYNPLVQTHSVYDAAALVNRDCDFSNVKKIKK
jgi:hypothetical protein